MLTSSESWFTTQASLSESAATDTGSSPTGISATRFANDGGPWLTSKTESRLSGVLTTSRRLPDGVRQAGWTCALSKWTKSVTTLVREASRCGAADSPAASASPASKGGMRRIGVSWTLRPGGRRNRNQRTLA